MGKRRARGRVRGDSGSFWISYSDMMAAMLFVFALILFVSLYQLVELQQTKSAELKAKEEELSTQQTALISAQTQLTTQQTTLDAQAALLAQSQAQLSEKEQELVQKQDAFDLQATALADAQSQIAAAQISLATQQQRLDEQEALLSSQQTKIDNLVGVRSRIIEDLRDELSKADLDTGVDKNTGAITFKGAVLFDLNSADLKESGKLLLAEFLPIYLRTLMSGENAQYIGEIIIEGHTDPSGPYLLNLELSQQRALAVVTYCLSDEFTGLTQAEKELLYDIMTANGRSWSDPIYGSNGRVDADASRRVEFKFRLKDAEMIDEMSRILEGSNTTQSEEN